MDFIADKRYRCRTSQHMDFTANGCDRYRTLQLIDTTDDRRYCYRPKRLKCKTTSFFVLVLKIQNNFIDAKAFSSLFKMCS